MINKIIRSKKFKNKFTRIVFKILRLNFLSFFPKKYLNNRFLKDAKNEILIFTSIGGHTYYSRFDRMLERAFNLLGYNVVIILCNSELNICQEFTHELSKSNLITKNFKNFYCNLCYKHGIKIFKNSKIELLNQYSQIDLNEITNEFDKFIDIGGSYYDFKFKDINFGEHIKSALIRYYGGYINIEKDNYFNHNLKSFALASFKTYLSVKKIISKYKIHISILHHGIYIPQGVINETLKVNNIDFYTYTMSYRYKTFFFAYGDTYHKKFLNIEDWDNFEFTNDHYKMLKIYFDEKKINNQDWIDFTNANNFKEFKKIEALLKPYTRENIFVMYTNVTWDAQVHFENNVFSSIFEWIDLTIEYFKKNPDKILVVRAHPAEIYGNVSARDKINDYIKTLNTSAMENLILIDPNEKINSYHLMSVTDNFLIYSSKISIELLFYNKKVLIAGESYVRNKGFTVDVKNKQNYFEDLDRLYEFNLKKDIALKAKKFIYFFFFKLMVKVNQLKKSKFKINHPFIFDEFSFHELKNDESFFNALNDMLLKKKIISQD